MKWLQNVVDALLTMERGLSRMFKFLQNGIMFGNEFGSVSSMFPLRSKLLHLNNSYIALNSSRLVRFW